ncbi:uracil phosphoribosyltransferase-domain-containing protein [Colletotrichum phormii]|uniref:Uracil phosphoribosyltransferase-domain-containing protein n=1 Tax=Colletotrichum phormii TaxID=359342 RepID=A0AAJ0EL26_9PEZI|nr:uracil phosphoribosyltransferase-domain-containing protein [Colletotrichum phormii]KAK1655172.1 uracil phosphoribosyltransferase-domain-containing protein [Colletotrichum phormii]
MSALSSSTTLSINKPIVVGLYGLPGSGKSYVLRHLKTYFGVGNQFQYYEGSEVIGNLVDGGLEAFKRLDKDTRNLQRQRAIQLIADECTTTGRIGIVTGHYSFWNDKNNSPRKIVWTEGDRRVYTHILYLDMPADRLWGQRQDDESRSRPNLQPNHLSKWQNAEMAGLSRLSRLNGMYFMPLHLEGPRSYDGIQHMLRNLVTQDEENLGRVRKETDRLLFSDRDGYLLDTVLVLDADRTLCAADTGSMFWERLKATLKSHDQDRIWDVPETFGGHWLWDDPVCPLKRLFSEKNYSFASFNQAMSLYDYVDGAFDEICEEVASAVSLYPEFMALIHAVKRHRGVGIVIVTCGLRQIWKLILEREGLDDSVEIIGGGRFADGYVVTPEAKAVVVSQIQAQGVSVWAFGDSPIDLPMLKMADQAIVVVGEKRFRSKTMDAELAKAIADDKDFLPRQALIPNHSTPRLTPDQLPIVDISGQAFMESFLYRYANLRVLHATKKSATKLLMTPTRDASVTGPSLRAAHGHVGRYLATEFLTELLGLEYFPIPHVQGYKTDGHRLVDESRTAIVALMRGGEPMAFGVGEAFPGAIFIHAKHATELTKKTLGGMTTLLLVDSVVNSGKSIKEFVDHIRGLELGIRIVVVAGVVQAKAMSNVLEPLACEGDLSLVALRLSDNKFTGSGGTDTGNRLFNTVHLD